MVAVLAASEPADWLARFGSADLRRHDAQAAELRATLAGLPPAPEDHSSARVGWHSTFSFGPRAAESARSVTVDLGASAAFDSVVLVPVNIAEGMRPGPGYGFPVRFRVESAEENSFAAPVILADRSDSDFPNPGNFPVWLETPGARGRFVRVTATRLFSGENKGLFALGELMVWQGKRNLAAGCGCVASGNYENAPTWQTTNLTDGQSVLGPPLRAAPVPRNGYHSQVAIRPDTEKWVQLDLGAAQPINEVRLLAARPIDFPARSGFGFPLRFRLEASATADFAQPIALLDFSREDCVNPGDNPLVVPVREVTARYVRLTATRLWERHHDFVFALSEMQVFSGGENIALAATPSALDTIDINRWSLAFVNDGFESEGELVDWPDWLRCLSRRREIAQGLASLEGAREPLVAAAWRRLGEWSFGALAALVLLAAGWLFRQRAARRRELARLRQRIAGDLHDEIGSNLGSIALLARLAGDHQPSGASADLQQIQLIAEETADSMRDIVWLMRPGERAAADLLTRLREVAAQQLGGLSWRFDAGGVTGPFPLEFERQVLLLFKEALNNIRKHARAQMVTIRLAQEGLEFRLAIEDDGAGFDAAAPASGMGLASMRHRAEILGAQFTLESQPGRGTRLTLHTRLP